MDIRSARLLKYININWEHRVMIPLHDTGFYLSILFTLAHVFAITHHANLPILKAMFTNGRVALRWAEEHMPRYIKARVAREEVGSPGGEG